MTANDVQDYKNEPALRKASAVSFSKTEKRFVIDADFFETVRLAESEQEEFYRRAEAAQRQMISMEFDSPEERATR